MSARDRLVAMLQDDPHLLRRVTRRQLARRLGVSRTRLYQLLGSLGYRHKAQWHGPHNLAAAGGRGS
jgi:DNA-binding MurR/RpiR family transcriptional regulator